MDSMRLEGSDTDLDQFAQNVLKGSVSIESLSPFERRVQWALAGNTGRVSAAQLRSGITLSAATLRWEQLSAMAVHHSPSVLEFVVSRGPGLRIRNEDGTSYVQGDNTFHVGQVKRPVSLHCEWEESGCGVSQEHLCLAIPADRLNELLGTQQLPAALQRIIDRPDPYPRDTQPMIPQFFRLLDEIVYSDGKGIARHLYLEAKGLEMLAAMVDLLEENERAASPLLHRQDVDRLHRARQLLLTRLEAPPTLPELARQAGLNEAKLKAGFRTLFGSSVFEYLRHHRLDEAHRLLRQRAGNVTEVAQRVGYANPSKFAAAFRKRFGVSPSDVA